MIIWFYLVISKDRSVRLVKNKPRGLSMNQVLVSMSVEVPAEIFERPLLTASIRVEKEAVPPVEVRQEVLIAAKNAVEVATGLRLELLEVKAPSAEAEPPKA